ncbi:MAG: hypothetical protein GQ535_16045 [Rhodobacteraceae bacterium]|nr:hypothetical protein [Paracoccaceae bacterium]
MDKQAKKKMDKFARNPDLTRFTGSFVGIVTPFNEDHTINYDRLRELVEFQAENGTKGINFLAIGGEGSAISRQERAEFLRITADFDKAGMTFVYACIGNSTKDVCEMVDAVANAGGDAAMVMVPPNIAPSDRDSELYFGEIARNSAIPLGIFNNPARLITDLRIETVERLLRHEKIVFYKEGSSQTGKVIDLLTKDLDACIFADDVTDPDTLVGAWSMGADGIFNISANIIPNALATLAQQWRSFEDVLSFRALVADVLPVIRYCYDGRAPINLKRAMNTVGLDVGPTRPPLNIHGTAVPTDIAARIRKSQKFPERSNKS